MSWVRSPPGVLFISHTPSLQCHYPAKLLKTDGAVVILVGHRHQQLQVLQPHGLSRALKAFLQLHRAQSAVQIFVEEAKGLDELDVFLPLDLGFLPILLFGYLLINPINSKRVSYWPYWMLFSLSISWISSSVASWPNLRMASRHSCVITPSPGSRCCRCRRYQTRQRFQRVP